LIFKFFFLVRELRKIIILLIVFSLTNSLWIEMLVRNCQHSIIAYITRMIAIAYAKKQK